MKRPILLATDGSPSARQATEEAISLAAALATPLHVISVWSPGALDRDDAEFVLQSVRIEAEATGLMPVLHLRDGNAADEILTAAAIHEPRMIVVGQHGWSTKHAPGGSVSSAVRQRTRVPVLVVPDSVPAARSAREREAVPHRIERKEPTMTPHPAAEALIDELERAGIPYDTVPHMRTSSALAEARALGVEPAAVAKTVVLSTPKGFIRAVIPASERLDIGKVRKALEVQSVDLLTEAGLADEYPEFELGAVPPVGGSHHDRVLVDIGVCEHEFVLVEAGTHEGSVRIASADLAGHRSALIADICAV